MKELLIISLLGIAVMAADILKMRKAIFGLVVLGLLGLIGTAIADWGHNENPFGNNMLLMDNFALGFTVVLGLLALAWIVLTTDFFGTDSRRTDLYALSIFSLCGAILMVSFTNLVMLFLGIEILSIPLYVLAASNRRDVRSNEAGFKYFFLGSLASAILLFGIALVYGATGTFDLSEILNITASHTTHSTLMTTGVAMMLVGFGFKISVAPFHFWAPDVYQGSPTPITAFMATVVKGAAFAAMYRLFTTSLVHYLPHFEAVLAFSAGLTLILANTVGSIQSSVKRLLAYSSVSHAGFMLGAVMVAQTSEPKYLMYYVLTYGIASLTAFIVLHQVSSIQGGAEGTEAFHGLYKRNPLMAGALTVALFSMAGIPPLSGFMAKYFVISNVISAGHLTLAIVMILTSVVAMYYYLKLIVAMFTPIENAGRIVITSSQRATFAVFTFLMVALFFGASAVALIHW